MRYDKVRPWRSIVHSARLTRCLLTRFRAFVILSNNTLRRIIAVPTTIDVSGTMHNCCSVLKFRTVDVPNYSLLILNLLQDSLDVLRSRLLTATPAAAPPNLRDALLDLLLDSPCPMRATCLIRQTGEIL